MSLPDRLGLRHCAAELADRVIAYISGKRHATGGEMKQDGLLPLLATMQRLRLSDQADKLSSLLGYSAPRPPRRDQAISRQREQPG
jgi:hypothetical protein